MRSRSAVMAAQKLAECGVICYNKSVATDRSGSERARLAVFPQREVLGAGSAVP